MSSGAPPDPLKGVDLDAARRTLRGLVVHTLDVDWLGVDPTGNVAVFLGEDGGPIPSTATPEATSKALEAVTQALVARLAARAQDEAYRVAAEHVRDPVFDVPRTLAGALHEKPFSGYPHLVVATPPGAAALRQAMVDAGGNEVQTRAALGIVFDSMGFALHEALHDERVCAGCRVLDDPRDPRPRSPEVLARAGLYVYAYAGADDTWMRVASPSVAADPQDFLDLAHHTTAFLRMDERFEETGTIARRG